MLFDVEWTKKILLFTLYVGRNTMKKNNRRIKEKNEGSQHCFFSIYEFASLFFILPDC